MSVEHVITRSVVSGGITYGGRLSVTAGAEAKIDETIPAPSTNLLLALAVDVSQLKSVAISCSRNINLFFNDPSTGAPDKTINLIADQPYTWDNLSLLTNPFSVDIDSLYVTLASGSSAVLKASFLVDPTL